jgi:hypothetical protein
MPVPAITPETKLGAVGLENVVIHDAVGRRLKRDGSPTGLPGIVIFTIGPAPQSMPALKLSPA